MSWMFVHLPRFALEVQTRFLPEEAGFALVEPGHSGILLVNDRAEQAGVKAGMSTSSACALHPDLQLISRRPDLEEQGLLDLAQILLGYAAQISLKPPQGLLLEIASMLRLFGGLEPYWRQVREGLHQSGFQAWTAVAHTPLAAQLLTQQGDGSPTLDPDALHLRLRSLPITQSLLPDLTIERLLRMGIKSLGQLLDLPPAEVGRRFGREVPLFLERLLGTAPDPQVFFRPPEHFYRRLDFLGEIESINGLLFPLQRLLKELQTFLQARQQATLQILIEIGHHQRDNTQLEIRSVQPEYRADEWLQLCRLRMERVQLYAGALSLALKADALQPLQSDSDDLFRQQQLHQLSRQQLLGRLQARLGAQQIQSLAVRADHRPEQANQVTAPGASSDILPPQGVRPLWLLPEPLPIACSQLQLLQGPERIQAGWWDAQPPRQVCRDYYVANTRDGSLCWVYRTPEEQWFIQGWFG